MLSKVRQYFRSFSRKTKNIQIHRNDEKDLIKEERKKSKKAKIVEYDSNDKSLIISGLINKYKVLDISKWKINIKNFWHEVGLY